MDCSPTASPSARSVRDHLPIVQQTVDEVVRVGNDEICAAIKDVFDDTRAVMEPAGALAVAGPEGVGRARAGARSTLVAVLSGEHQFRSASIRRRARGGGEAARGAAGRDDPGAARRIS